MHYGAEGIHRLVLQQHIHLLQVGLGVACGFVVQTGIALRLALHLVEEIGDDFAQRQPVADLHPFGAQIFQLGELASAFLAELHQSAGVVGGGDGGDRQIRLGDGGDFARRRHLARIIHTKLFAGFGGDEIFHRRRGRHEINGELPMQPLVDDFHMQQPQKSAAEAEPQSGGAFRLKAEAGVVEAELVHSVSQHGIVVSVYGIQPAEHHRLGLLVAVQRSRSRAGGRGDRLARASLRHIFHACDEIAHLPRCQLLHRRGRRQPHAHFQSVLRGARLHQQHL